MTDLPLDLPLVERDVVRLIVRDAADRILLFHTHDPAALDLGQWWELPGGGIEDGETYLEAALRELHEETGIVVAAERVGLPTWRRTASFRHRDRRHLQHEVVVEVALGAAGCAIDVSGRLDYELEDYFDFRWWPISEVAASDALFYPRSLPRLLPGFLAGQRIDEQPLELWS